VHCAEAGDAGLAAIAMALDGKLSPAESLQLHVPGWYIGIRAVERLIFLIALLMALIF